MPRLARHRTKLDHQLQPDIRQVQYCKIIAANSHIFLIRTSASSTFSVHPGRPETTMLVNSDQVYFVFSFSRLSHLISHCIPLLAIFVNQSSVRLKQSRPSTLSPHPGGCPRPAISPPLSPFCAPLCHSPCHMLAVASAIFQRTFPLPHSHFPLLPLVSSRQTNAPVWRGSILSRFIPFALLPASTLLHFPPVLSPTPQLSLPPSLSVLGFALLRRGYIIPLINAHHFSSYLM